MKMFPVDAAPTPVLVYFLPGVYMTLSLAIFVVLFLDAGRGESFGKLTS